MRGYGFTLRLMTKRALWWTAESAFSCEIIDVRTDGRISSNSWSRRNNTSRRSASWWVLAVALCLSVSSKRYTNDFNVVIDSTSYVYVIKVQFDYTIGTSFSNSPLEISSHPHQNQKIPILLLPLPRSLPLPDFIIVECFIVFIVLITISMLLVFGHSLKAKIMSLEMENWLISFP